MSRGAFQKLHGQSSTLRTTHEILSPGAPEEDFGRTIFKKNLPWGTVLKFSQRRRQLLVEVRRGAGTCAAPCILDYHCSSASLYLHKGTVQKPP